jgi:hypothetical protein
MSKTLLLVIAAATVLLTPACTKGPLNSNVTSFQAKAAAGKDLTRQELDAYQVSIKKHLATEFSDGSILAIKSGKVVSDINGIRTIVFKAIIASSPKSSGAMAFPVIINTTVNAQNNVLKAKIEIDDEAIGNIPMPKI